MPTEHLQWVSLDECITGYMNKADLSNHKYFKLWHIAFEGLTNMGLDAFYNVRSIKIPVNENLTAPLPADYLQYSKVGVLNQQGEIIPMGVNSKLTVAFDLNSTRVAQTTDNTIPTQINQQGVWWYNYWNGQSYGQLYGLPSGAPIIGSFKIDTANDVIVLSENFNYPYVMLEYVASPQVGGDYFIPIQFKSALIAFLAWQDIAYIPVKTHAHNAGVESRRRDYFNERRLAIARYDPVNLPDLYQWNLEMQRVSIKN